MKIVEVDGFIFHFEDALEAFVFDETDKAKPTYHGVAMKGVDIVVELPKAHIYVEVKNYENTEFYGTFEATSPEEENVRKNHFKWLKDYLKYKFRDTYLYRHAEDKVDKPIHYICLLTFDNALNSRMQKVLKYELPVGKASHRWVRALAQSCHVVNLERWHKNFPKWQITRLSQSQN